MEVEFFSTLKRVLIYLFFHRTNELSDDVGHQLLVEFVVELIVVGELFVGGDEGELFWDDGDAHVGENVADVDEGAHPAVVSWGGA